MAPNTNRHLEKNSLLKLKRGIVLVSLASLKARGCCKLASVNIGSSLHEILNYTPFFLGFSFARG